MLSARCGLGCALRETGGASLFDLRGSILCFCELKCVSAGRIELLAETETAANKIKVTKCFALFMLNPFTQ